MVYYGAKRLTLVGVDSVSRSVFIVHAHAEPQSFNGALTRLAVETLEAQGYQVCVSDLYAMGFNPVSDRRNFTSQKDATFFKQQQEELHASQVNGFAGDIEAELAKLEACDVLIFQFPLWWFGLPAILKGWVDKVFAMGRVYGGGKWYDNGAFVGKRALVSLTTGGPQAMYGSTGLNGDLEQILYPIHHGMLYFVGFEVLPPFVAWAPSRSGEETRQQYLQQYRQRLLTLDSTPALHFPRLADYDEHFQLKPAAVQ